MAHRSEKSRWGAYFAMKEAGGDHVAAKAIYSRWVPEEPVSKWKSFAPRVYKQVLDGAKSLARPLRLKAPGPKPFITDEIALKIGTVYSQRLVWEHGTPRHYTNMAEVRSGSCPAPVPLPAPR